MNKEKKIEEMAIAMCRNRGKDGCCGSDDELCDLQCVYGYCAERIYCADYRHISEFLQMVENICKYEYSLSFEKIKEGVLRQMKGE